jgi:predicted TPR repeat methyltransferase
MSAKMLARLRQGYFGADTTTVEASIEQYVADCGENFDLITSMSVMEMVPELPNTLCRTAMLLNRGGILAFTYMPLYEGAPREEVVESPQIGQNVRRYRWLPEEVEQTLAARGLTIVERGDVSEAYKYNPSGGPTATVDYNFLVARAGA